MKQASQQSSIIYSASALTRRRGPSIKLHTYSYMEKLCYTDTSLKPLSRIRYVSDMDTCPIRPGYISSEYPLFYYFCDNGICHWIRILLPDTARPSRSPGRQTLSSAPTPAVRSPAVPHGDELTAAPACRAATPLTGRRPPATSLRLRSPAAGDEPPPPLASVPTRLCPGALRRGSVS